MSRSYYYFAASLPMLQWDGKLPVTVEEFISECGRLLDAQDFAVMGRLLKGDGLSVESTNPSVNAWIQFNNSYRNELAVFRAKWANKDPNRYTRGEWASSPQIRDVITQAAKMPHLLEAEKLLDQMVWQFLDDLTGGHYYDFEFLLAYGLRLKILERHQKYRSPDGKKIFDEIRMMEFPESCLLETTSVDR